ncbi:MAG: hypothetical protein J6T23_08005 [Elusimicrobia bacterium]|nr:hypothetical protein [Elusimicrobiota bacterium]
MNLVKTIILQVGVLFFFSNFLFAEFTIGLYGVKTSSDVVLAKEAGFNCVQTYISEPATINLLAEEAMKNDIKLVVYPTKIMTSKYKEKAKNYPIKAWYLFDEPDVWKISREKLISLNTNVKKIYPDIQTTFVLGQGFPSVPYYDIADILMVDWYPVPHLPLESFGENIALAKQGLIMMGEEEKELWAVVQLFDWKEYKQYRKDEDRIGRFPKKEEIKFMSYDAIFNGATGLFYFTCYSEGKPLSEAKPKDWIKTVEVIQEMSFVGEIIDNGKEIENPIEIKEPLKAKSFEYGGIKYTFVMNPTSKRQSLPSLFFQPQFDIMYEKSTNIKKIMRQAKNNLQPYSVLAFRYE